MQFLADLHIHSPLSRATSKALSFETLYQWGCVKGISLIGSGDFTHPAWLDEIKEKLEPDENGLLKLKKTPPPLEGFDTVKEPDTGSRFMITGEISNIYKADGKTRKVHNLICMPDINTATRFANKLDRIGNIRSDGRPILGLDSRDLLEIMLEVSEKAVLIPAHIWTPWFSVLGSKSGFDSVAQCYRDLADHIFAIETGLSSDPPMNWMVSSLDEYTLVSNSDAHSASKLGREANCFDCELSYESIMNALRKGHDAGFRGTLEFFPEEGKYHYDGHRKCDICFTPEQSKEHDGRCPVCGKKLTLGVMYRVVELADRKEGDKPSGVLPFKSVLSLDSVLSEIIDAGPSSKKVQQEYQRLINALGPELEILLDVPLDEIEKKSSSLLKEAIRRLRNGKINASPGYDGEFGVIRAFAKNEIEKIKGQISLFSEKDTVYQSRKKKTFKKKVLEVKETDSPKLDLFETPALEQSEKENNNQQAAIESSSQNIIVVAGPGTGKTRTLVERIIYLIIERSVPPSNIMAATFSNRAAQEMAERIHDTLIAQKINTPPLVTTFHKLGFQIISENLDKFGLSSEPVILSEKEMLDFFSHVTGDKNYEAAQIENIAELEKKILTIVDNNPNLLSDVTAIYSQSGLEVVDYTDYKKRHGFLDFTDLLLLPLSLLSQDKILRKEYQERWSHIFVDEYQDVNTLQYRLIKLLATEDNSLFVIGDPDQAIYGFRGSDVRFFSQFTDDFQPSQQVILNRSYRSTQTIIKSSSSMIESTAISDKKSLWSSIRGTPQLDINELPTENAEAEHVLKMIELLIGGSSYFAVDSGRWGEGDESGDIAFHDIAILYRIHSVGDAIEKALARSSIPIQRSVRRSILDDKNIKKALNFIRCIHNPKNSFFIQQLFLSGIPGISRQTGTQLTQRAAGFEEHYDIFEWLKNSSETNQRESTALTRIIDCRDAVLAAVRQKNMPEAIKRSALGMGISEEELTQPHWQLLIDKAAFISTTGELFSSLSLSRETDYFDPRAEGVSLMTLHASKGLEWRVVFIVGCEDGLLPLTDGNRQTNLHEERRLLYVGMTRAKTNLFLSYARSRRIFGSKEKRLKSPFLSDIPDELINFNSPELPQRFKKKRDDAIQLGLFD